MSLAPRSQSPGPSAIALDDIPARQWSENRCAAGALSEILQFLGDAVTEEQLRGSLPAARHGGVTTVDLLLAARARGFDARLERGDAVVVERELTARRPLLIVLRVMDAPGRKDDLFHYVVLSGLDPDRRLVRMHYGDGKRRWAALDRVEPLWAASGHAVLLIGPKTKRMTTEDDLRRAVLMETSGRTVEAIALYRRFLSDHPQSVLGWTNLGNAQAAAGQAHLAEVSYRNALVLDRGNCDALNNLAWLLFGQKRLDEAEELARRAAAAECPDRDLVLDTLAKILAAKSTH